MFSKQAYTFILFCFLFIYIPNAIYGQVEGDSVLFNYVGKQELDLDSIQTAKLDTMINNVVYTDHYYIEVNKLSDIHNEGNIYVNLPTGDSLNYFDGQHIEFDTIDEVTYYGILREPPCFERGYIQIYAGENKVFGQINIRGEEYQIHDLGEKQNVLFKIDDSIFNTSECATLDSTQSTDSIMAGDEDISLRASNHCIVSVLILYTDAATKVSNPVNQGRLLFQILKRISSNSEAEVQFHLDGIDKLDNFIEEFPDGSYSISELRNSVNLTLSNLTNSQLAKSLRSEDNYSSDLVILLTDGNWEIGRKNTANYEKIFGIANLNNFSDKDYAFALVEADVNATTFPHEAFHLFGCKHNGHERSDPPFIYEAQGHNMGPLTPYQDLITLMHLNSSKYFRAWNLSNPDVSINSVPTGISGESENEKQASSRACPISDYYPLKIPVTSYISGPRGGNNSGKYTWCAEIQNCANISHVIWSYSYNGFDYNYHSTQYPGSSYCITQHLPYDKDLYLKIKVVCDDDNISQSHESFIYVYNSDNNNCNQQPILSEVNENEHSLNDDIIKVNPNPVNDVLNINIKLLEISSMKIEITDISGKVVSELMKGEKSQSFIKSINLVTYPAGTYYIVLKTDNKTYTKKFIKL